MAISTLENPKFRAGLLTTGLVNDSGYVYIYTVGGTYNLAADQATVWTDKAKTTPHTQPIQLDAAGEAEIWFDGTYDIRVEDSANALQDTIIGVESSVSATVTGNFNLVNNGSFETDTASDGAPDDWTLAPTTNATIAIDSTSGGQNHGVNGLKFTSVDSLGGGTATSTIFDVTASGTLTTSFDFKQADAATGTYSVIIEWYKYDGNVSSTATTTSWSSTSGASTTWATTSNADAVPSDATQAKVRLTGLLAGGTDTVGTCWFDNIEVIGSAATASTSISGAAASTISLTGLSFTTNATIEFEATILGVTNAFITPVIELNSDTTVTNYRRNLYTNGNVGTQANDNDFISTSFDGSVGDYIVLKGSIHQNTTKGDMVVLLTTTEVSVGAAVIIHKSTISYELSGSLTALAFSVQGGGSYFDIGSTLKVHQI